MNAKNLQKATLLLAEIHELDKQLIALDKKAMAIADGDKHTNISLTFEKDKPEKDTSIIEDDYLGIMRTVLSGYGTSPMAAKTNKDIHKFKLTDNECLFIIGALISAKKEHRRLLCGKILALGVSL